MPVQAAALTANSLAVKLRSHIQSCAASSAGLTQRMDTLQGSVDGLARCAWGSYFLLFALGFLVAWVEALYTQCLGHLEGWQIAPPRHGLTFLHCTAAT